MSDGDGEEREPMQAERVVDRADRVERIEHAAVAAARAGDAVAFAALFDSYHGPITSYLYRLTGSRETADDLAQETFIKAFRALGRTSDDLNFRAWLYRIATNSAVSWRRRQQLLTWLPFSRSDDSGTPEFEPGHDPRLAESLAEQELVATALRRIGPKHASALLLRHHLRLTVDETAAALDINANTAKVRLFRARRAFIDAYNALDTDTNRTPARETRS
ncbi:MAG TPA: RNA polymerase sigma factor [Thermomicrobiales bacterium]|nr:RNA polymerase sigma factor [Thermomicrobiales bacterium]